MKTTTNLSNSGISKPKRYNQTLIKTVSGAECHFRNVLWMDLDFMITQTEVNLGENFSTGKLIKQDIDAG
jgi:hypothetical protein